MNSVLIAAKRLADLDKRPMPLQTAKLQTRQNFASYLVEQSIALLGTWLQQVVVAWLTHGVVHGPQIVAMVSPQVAGVLTMLGSALTWLLLTVWTFKLRERFYQFTESLRAVRVKLSTNVWFCLLNWARKGHRHCS